MVGFTDQELAEMEKSDAEIEREFARDWQEPSQSCSSDLVWVSRLARRSHTTYGKFVTIHSPEEIKTMIQLEQKGDTYEVSI